MKPFSMTRGAVALVLCIPAVGAPDAKAQEAEQVQAGKLDDATSGANIRASQLSGMPIRNLEGKNVGSVADIVIDADSGRVRYVAVSYGGFLGFGDKLFAVPWEAFSVRTTQDRDEYFLALDVSEEKIENAEGFDKNRWPNFSDREFTHGLDIYYGVERRRGDSRGGVEVRVGPGGVDVEVQGERRRRDR